MARKSQYYIRKTHRYLGLFIGIQFTLWTVGGLYFTWTDLDEIHGDHLRKAEPKIGINQTLASPSIVINSLKEEGMIDSITSFKLIELLGKPVYQVQFLHQMNNMSHKQVKLFSAISGEKRGPVTKKEATQMAENRFLPDAEIKSVEYLTKDNVGSHHEYRKKPFPAWAITFDHPSNNTVYIAAELGQVSSFRHGKWRIFDFLWMLHTMDYEGRDNFNNLIIRSFSILGLITICSGFLLYYKSSPTVRRVKRKLV